MVKTSSCFLQYDDEYNYKKRVLVQNKLSLVLKIILYNALTLQLFTINKAK